MNLAERQQLLDASWENQRDLHQAGDCKGTDPDIWFEWQVRPVHRNICGACPVAEQCLEYALAYEPLLPKEERIGIYNATTPKERAEIRLIRQLQERAS